MSTNDNVLNPKVAEAAEAAEAAEGHRCIKSRTLTRQKPEDETVRFVRFVRTWQKVNLEQSRGTVRAIA